MPATSVSLINMKGGVGKTTLAMQLAIAAAQAGQRVLAIDLDPQANLSQALLGAKGYRNHIRDDQPTVIQIFEGYKPPTKAGGSPSLVDPNDVIIPKVGRFARSKLALIPSRLELSNTLRNPTGKERRLAKAIAKVSNDYDLIVIDCAPTDSILTDAAYFASRWVIIPIKPEFMATMGLPLLGKSLDRFKSENEDQSIDILGLLFVNSSSYSSGPEGRQAVGEVKEFAAANEWNVFKSEVRYSASYPKSAREGTSIGGTSYAQWATISAFEKVKAELFKALGITVSA